MQGDQFEIRGGKMALRISHNAQVRSLARTLIKDHTKSCADAMYKRHLKLAKAAHAAVK